MIIHSSVAADPHSGSRAYCVNVGGQEQELPAVVLLLMLDHPLDLCQIELSACVLHAVCHDNKGRVLRDILRSGITVDARNVLNGLSQRIQQRRAATDGVISFRHWSDLRKFDPVMDCLHGAVKENRCDIAFARDRALLFDQCVKPTDRVALQPAHGSAAIQNEDQLCCVVFHKKTSYTAFFVYKHSIRGFFVLMVACQATKSSSNGSPSIESDPSL